MGNTKNTGYLQNIVQYDASNNITLPARLAVTGTVSINNTTPYDTTQFSLDVNGGLLVKNVGRTAQFVLINSNPASGGNNAFIVHTVGGTSAASYADIQGYYGTSIAGSTVIRLNPQGGNVLVGSLAGTGTRVVVADATGVLSTQAAQTIGDLNGVPTSRTITINGTTYDLSANRSWSITSMIYPGAGIAVSTGTAWGTSITDNSANWNTAYGWGNHASAGYATTTYVGTAIANLVASAPAALDTLNELAAALGNDAAFSTTVSTALGNRLRIDIGTQGLTSTQQGYGRTNLGLGSLSTLSSIGNSYITDLAWSKITSAPAFITSYTETDTLATVTGRGASTSTAVTFSGGASISNLLINGAPAVAESSLALGAMSTVEGGQLTLNKATSYTYAAHLDIWQDVFRILYGTNTATSGVAMSLNLSTRQLILPQYTTSTTFTGTAAGVLAFDSSGNIITIAVPGGAVSSVNAGTGISVNQNTGAITVTNTGTLTVAGTANQVLVNGGSAAANGNLTLSLPQSIHTSATPTFDQVITGNNGNGTNFRIGDDAWIGDVNLANTFRVQGVQNAANGYIIFGNGDSTALGRASTGALTYGGNTVYHAGNLTNLNQLTNGPGYLTGITSSQVTTALGFTPYNSTNPSGYITSSSLTSYVPYTGATANIDTGGYSITAGAVTLTSNLWLKNIGTYDFIMSNATSVTTNTIRAYYNTSDELRFYAKNTAGSAVVPKIMVGDGTTFYTIYHTGNLPTIPTNNNQLINGAGYITSSGSISGSAGSVAWTNVSGRPTNVSSFTNDAGYITGVTNISGTAGTATNWSGYYGGLLNWSTANGTSTNGYNRMAARLYSLGRKINLDETFNYSANGISTYDNNSSGTISISRVAAPYGVSTSGYQLQIQHTGSSQTPGFGGFYFGTQTRSNATFACVFRAKLPSGYAINWASNATGSGGNNYWVTDNTGTGKYEDYVYVVRCGDSGSFSSTMFFYITGSPAPSAGSPLTWYLSSATVYDVDDRDNTNTQGYTPLTSNNYTSYSPSLTGSGASGTWGISITGNAATVGGYGVSGTVGANTVVIRDTNGYVYFNYINSNVSETENPTINSFYTSNGDGWLRKSSLAHVRSQLGNYGGWITGLSFDGLSSKTGGSGTYQTSGDFRAPIFYDSNDTSYYLDPNSTSRLYYVNAPQGYVSIGNPWGTANSAYFPNGITTAGGQNWIYGGTYIGNAPSNGSGVLINGNGSSYFRSSNTGGTWGYAGQFVDRNSASNNYIPWSFENEYGNHSWGAVARFHIQQSGADKPSIQFTATGSNDRWSIGYVTGSDYNFRITQNHGYRTDNSGSDGWGTERFKIDTSGNTYAAIGGTLYANGAQVITTSNIASQSVSYASSAGSAGSVSGLTLTSSANGINPDSVTQNQLGYNTSVSLFGQTDGGLYSSAYSSAWIHQIYGDFRTGQIAIRGKLSGTWQGWRIVLDSGNYTSYVPSLSATNTWTGAQNNFVGNGNTGSTNNVGLVVYSTGGNGAQMSFHRSGAYAINMGLDSDNVFRIGGWSASANRLQLDMSGNLTVAGSMYANGNRVVENSGTWSINVTGSAGSAGSVSWGNVSSKPAGWLDTTNLIADNTPGDSINLTPSGFYQNYAGAGNPTGTWFNYINVRHSNPGNGHGFQLGMSYYDSNLWFRSYQGSGSSNGWCRALSSANFTSFVDAPNAVGNGNGYYNVQNWLQVNGAHGIFWPGYYGFHIRPNISSTYTQMEIIGSKNSYGGIYDNYSAVNVAMYDSGGNGGVYREAQGRWYWYHHVGNNCTGISTSATSSSYRAYIGGSLYAEGDVVAYSDVRKKTDIATIDNALNKVLQLRGVYYTRIDDVEKGRQTGVIAQEINEVLPEVVTYAADIDEYGVAYGNIVGILIEAIKAQQLQIEGLKKQIEYFVENK